MFLFLEICLPLWICLTSFEKFCCHSSAVPKLPSKKENTKTKNSRKNLIKLILFRYRPNTFTGAEVSNYCKYSLLFNLPTFLYLLFVTTFQNVSFSIEIRYQVFVAWSVAAGSVRHKFCHHPVSILTLSTTAHQPKDTKKETFKWFFVFDLSINFLQAKFNEKGQCSKDSISWNRLGTWLGSALSLSS